MRYLTSSIVFLFLISNGQMFCQNIPAYLPSNGLVAWYPLNGNATDSSGNGNDGSVHGASPTTDRYGHLNSAYLFDGTGNYIGGSCTNFPVSARTISLWYNGVSIGSRTPPGKSIFGYGGQICGQSWIQSIYIDFYGLGMHCSNNGSTYNSDTVQNNSWHHWLITNDGVAETKFYIDGQLVYDTGNFYNNTFVTGKDFIIGAIPGPSGTGFYTDGNVGAFPGKIDDVAIYDRVLTACEIRQLYSGYTTNIISQPFGATAMTGSNAQFAVVTADPAASFQWQTDSASSGFRNIIDEGQYTGTSGTTLAVNAVTGGNDNQFFRSVVSFPGSCTIVSDAAQLHVSTTLGLSLISFTAVKKNQSVSLKWTSENESRLSLYTVERSSNAKDFYSVGNSIPLNSTLEHLYHFTDDSPEAGANFYRLKITETDGSFTYSTIRKVIFENSSPVTIYPNPCTGKFTIETNTPYTASATAVVVRNMLGQIVYRIRITSTITNIDQRNRLRPGCYAVQILNDAGKIKESKKLIVIPH